MDGKGGLARQHLRQAAVAQHQIRGGVSAGLRQRQRGLRLRSRPIPHFLQRCEGPTRALTARHPIKLTSPRCHSAWQPNRGRRSARRRGKTVRDNRDHLRAMIPKKRAPSGYGSVSSVAGPTGNPLITRHQIISGHAARDSAASPKKTQARTSPQHFKQGPLSAKKSPTGSGASLSVVD